MEDKINGAKAFLSHFIQNQPLIDATSERMLKGYKNILSGYEIDYKNLIQNRFSNAESNDIITFEKIDFFSMCEHHFIPFFGEIQISYIPKKNAIGFGAIISLVEAISRRLQLQERITREIAETIQESALNPSGVCVIISANHFCTLAKTKGQHKPSLVKTIFTTGGFNDEKSLKKLQLLTA